MYRAFISWLMCTGLQQWLQQTRRTWLSEWRKWQVGYTLSVHRGTLRLQQCVAFNTWFLVSKVQGSTFWLSSVNSLTILDCCLAPHIANRVMVGLIQRPRCIFLHLASAAFKCSFTASWQCGKHQACILATMQWRWAGACGTSPSLVSMRECDIWCLVARCVLSLAEATEPTDNDIQWYHADPCGRMYQVHRTHCMWYVCFCIQIGTSNRPC